MKTLKLYFKINFKKETQYRSALLSGVVTQLFFGMLFIFVYQTFYASNAEPSNFTLEQMSTYIWLQQSFYMMFKYYDGNKQLSQQIVNGDIAYQMLKPLSVYKQWFYDFYTVNITRSFVRAVPLILIAAFIPAGLGMTQPVSTEAFLLFLCTFFLGTILVVAVNMFSYILVSITLSPPAVFGLVHTICSVLAGSFVPLALLPNWFVNIASFFPFRYVSDLPYRIYVGNIPTSEVWYYLLIQLFWIVVLIQLGRSWLSKRLNNLVVQGG